MEGETVAGLTTILAGAPTVLLTEDLGQNAKRYIRAWQTSNNTLVHRYTELTSIVAGTAKTFTIDELFLVISKAIVWMGDILRSI